jgi:peptidoglycan hydrolase-like protein with peptidoglycan-binding domain
MNYPDANSWTEADYRALVREANKGDFRPEHWLCVTASESGLAIRREYVDINGKRVRGSGTFAQFEWKNAAGKVLTGARGLNQMMPKTLINLGFKAGDPDFDACKGDYRELSAARQIVWSGKYFQDCRRWTGVKEWNSPGQLYMANFMPAHVDKGKEFVLAADGANYEQNKGFDRNHKGYITVGDVYVQTLSSLNTHVYRVGVDSLNAVRQARLNECLPSREPLEEDGSVGSKTASAIKAFRSAAGLSLQGAFDAPLDMALFGTC